MTRCHDCDNPIATSADYDTIPEGQGDHLCWRDWNGGDCFHPEIDWRSRCLAMQSVIEAAEWYVDNTWTVDDAYSLRDAVLEYRKSKEIA